MKYRLDHPELSLRKTADNLRISESALKNWTFHVLVIMHGRNGFLRTRVFIVPF